MQFEQPINFKHNVRSYNFLEFFKLSKVWTWEFNNFEVFYFFIEFSAACNLYIKGYQSYVTAYFQLFWWRRIEGKGIKNCIKRKIEFMQFNNFTFIQKFCESFKNLFSGKKTLWKAVQWLKQKIMISLLNFISIKKFSHISFNLTTSKSCIHKFSL